MALSDYYISYAIPAAALTAALVIKAPSIVRAWRREPDVRAVAGLLVLATSVFVSAAPSNIARINALIGEPNVAAPIVYTLLTAFCASCLGLIITWREDPSPGRTRKVRAVLVAYGAVIVGLWVTFFPADAGIERLRDLDTYYATTPWMREHILLYLLAHTTSTVVAALLLWTWIPRVRKWPYLRAGLISMQIGYVIGIVYEGAKLSAYFARWAGNDLDWLSTHVAPPMAALNGAFVAVGFIIPQAGPFVQEHMRERRSYRNLGPLWRLMRAIDPSAAAVRLGPWAPTGVRLMRRESDINDGLLKLAGFLDGDLRARAYDEAVKAGHDQERAAALASAAAVTGAIKAFCSGVEPEDHGASASLGEDYRALEPISRALRRPAAVETILRRAATRESV